MCRSFVSDAVTARGMSVIDKCSRFAAGLHAVAATACKQEIKDAAETLLGQKNGEGKFLAFYAQDI